MTAAPLNGARPSTLTAFNIERQGPYPSAIHLKGGVEIKTPLCLNAGQPVKLVCGGYTVLKADEATFHEDSGAIEAQGSVLVTPVHDQSTASARE